uniref:Uncharacterized protein n=1 Tax=Ciona intestinalis TaxID=7719 RepID=F6YNY4_CIOIN
CLCRHVSRSYSYLPALNQHGRWITDFAPESPSHGSLLSSPAHIIHALITQFRQSLLLHCSLVTSGTDTSFNTLS